MKKIILLLICFVFTADGFAQNLIINPGAELDPLANGWTAVTQGTNCNGSSNWRIIGNLNNYPPAQQGSYFFYSGCGSVNGELYQSVDVSAYASQIDASFQSFTFSGYMRVYDQAPSDSGRIVVEYRNASAVVLSTYDMGYRGDRTAFALYTDTKTAPVGTRSIRIRLLSKNVNGTSVDAYFDNFSLTTTTLLPIKLLNFSASLLATNHVKLFWQTVAEINNDKFTVERSANGVDWLTITEVAARGNSNASINNYTIVDKTALQPLNYYRLKQTDVNGQFVYSNTITININPKKSISIFPNPAKDVINLTGEKLDVKDLQIFNVFGQDVTKLTSLENNGSQKVIINITKLNTGHYIIKTTTATGKFNKL